MAINDISLTSGMRSNLLSLQNTVELLDRTQTRLSTGKKVNTAIDNPVSYFASKSLTSRASIIDSLKDAMGQAVSTINAADKGISAISSMIEQAKGIAQSALSAEAGTTPADFDGNATNTVTYSNITLTVTTGGITTTGQTVSIGGVAFAALTSTGGIQFDGTAADLAAKIAANVTGYTANAVGDVITIANAAGDLADGDVTGTAVVAGTATDAAGPIAHSERMTITIGGANYTGTAATATLAAAALDTDIEGADGVQGATVSAAGVVHVDYDEVPSDELVSLQTQYNTLLTQMTELAEDSGYKGKNLLSATAGLRTMTVSFEGADLTVAGFDATATGLGITQSTAAGTTWTDGTTAINASITQLDESLVTLRSESSKLSGNLSIITVRQDFSTNMINTLTEGSDKLTLADSNEEGANMLMLQTRQSLSTTALSLSAQAAQSVLQLFG